MSLLSTDLWVGKMIQRLLVRSVGLWQIVLHQQTMSWSRQRRPLCKVQILSPIDPQTSPLSCLMFRMR